MPRMPNSWKFRYVPQTEHSVPPFYVQPWPDDLPEKCGICGTGFRYGFNLTIGPGKAGRILRSIAYLGFLPFMLIGLILPGLFPDFYSGLRGSHGWWLVFGVMFFPSMFLGGLSMTMPQTRLVECKKCGWKHDYRIRKPEVLPPVS
jgi:hypothetical protein